MISIILLLLTFALNASATRARRLQDDDGEEDYGYDWCVKYYDTDECYDYYFGSDDDKDGEGVGSGSGLDSNLDEEEYGYDWCLENYDSTECFEYYYGYKWCLDYYDPQECYDYYYPTDDWEWNEETNYKWCLNFYLPDECEQRYYTTAASNTKEWNEEPVDASGGFLNTLKSGPVLGTA